MDPTHHQKKLSHQHQQIPPATMSSSPCTATTVTLSGGQLISTPSSSAATTAAAVIPPMKLFSDSSLLDSKQKMTSRSSRRVRVGSSGSVVPRLCTLTIKKLSLLPSSSTSSTHSPPSAIQPPPEQSTNTPITSSTNRSNNSVLIAVKLLGGTRRTLLRSHEIPVVVEEGGTLCSTTVGVDLNFSLQYPHHLKSTTRTSSDSNKLLVMLQRKKRYKNRTILGYKTLAEGTIDLGTVLQRPLPSHDLALYEKKSKENHNQSQSILAKVFLTSVSSIAVDSSGSDDDLRNSSNKKRGQQQQQAQKKKDKKKGKHSDEEDEDEVEDFSDSDSDSPSNAGGAAGAMSRRLRRKKSAGGGSAPNTRNLKQKLVNLLKKFKQQTEQQRMQQQPENSKRGSSSTTAPTVDGDGAAAAAATVREEIENLFDDLSYALSDDYSLSDENDTLSVGSFPKPALPPFFASSKSLVHYGTPPPTSGPLKSTADAPTTGKHTSSSNRNSSNDDEDLEEESDSDTSADSYNNAEPSPKNKHHQQPLFSPISKSPPPPLPLLLTDHLPDEVTILLSSPSLQSSFNSLNCTTSTTEEATLHQICNKLTKFCNNNNRNPPPITIVVIGPEAYLNSVLRQYVQQLSGKSQDWQPKGNTNTAGLFGIVYVPVPTSNEKNPSNPIWKHVVQADASYASSFNLQELSTLSAEDLAKRVLHYVGIVNNREDRAILPFAIGEAMITYKENQESNQVFVPFIGSGVGVEIVDEVELQLDYWKGNDVSKKNSVKGGFKFLKIDQSGGGLRLEYCCSSVASGMGGTGGAAKQKIMQLGGKITKKKTVTSTAGTPSSSDPEPNNTTITGISRVVCLSKSQNLIKLTVDTSPFTGVKFFQVSSQWQFSHVKVFPVLIK